MCTICEVLYKSPSETTKPSSEDALLYQCGHKGGFRALQAQPVSPSRGAGADTTLLSISGETELKLGRHWCCLCPKPLAAPAPKAKSPQSKEGKGGKKSLRADFTEGGQQDIQDCQILGLQAGLRKGVGGVWHRDSHQGGFRVLNSHQHSTDQNYSRRFIMGCF